MKRQFFDSALGQVHFIESGDPGTDSLILMHQVPRSVDEFAEVMPLLSRQLHVIAMDFPGYGSSDRPATQPTVEQYAEVAMALADNLGLDRVSLGGHHTGAVVSVEAAATHPDRVDNLVLSGVVYMDEESRQELSAIFKQWHVQPDGSHFMEKWTRFADWISDPGLIQRCLVDLFRAGETSEFGHFAVAEYHMEDRLPRVRARTRLLVGRQDPFGYPEKNQIFPQTLADCEMEMIDGGIFVLNEDPQLWADRVLAFMCQ